ncbi:MAG: 30S ribosomal protein S18 [Candidatus Magasanikbacteria bacterium]|uniref:Small ribosomal subunit protein bS18 n=1 Tax=Candidatus Magasanikbacteria bacterium CG10_big_fil_rev_8_21_14_0_10_38_6 TaxID=1974647 RepID=A0A2M6P208_9BACT|nr:30S ribosomal protein S18 [Candidatus Magasanikbacteria bacterium]PIR77731.1 MAG: 30S ribosomal protein S18 [Candidatus Magasanikbacteria bacterium CG10_big_fil_rev_8_21_14_0_10_38_6]
MKRTKTTRPCHFCVHNETQVDWKDTKTLRRFLSSNLKIAARRRSGLCSKHQRNVARSIKQARIAGLLGFITK